MMNEKTLADIRARADAATAGPWEYDPDLDGLIEAAGGGAVASAAHHVSMRAIVATGQNYNHADATFIAHARADVPALLGEIDRLRALANQAAACAGDFV